MASTSVGACSAVVTWPVASTKRRNSVLVTVVASIQKPSMRTRCGGCSSARANAPTLPLVNSPPAIQTMSRGVVLVRSEPGEIARIVTLGRASYRKMIQNLRGAAGNNVIAIPLAVGVLAWAGILLAPAVGAVLMAASAVIAAINAQLFWLRHGRAIANRVKALLQTQLI